MSLSFDQQAEFVRETWEKLSNQPSNIETATAENDTVTINGSDPVSDTSLVQVIDKPITVLSEMFKDTEEKLTQNPLLFIKIGETGLVAVTKKLSSKPEDAKLKVVSALLATKKPVLIKKVEDNNVAVFLDRSIMESATGINDENIGNPHVVLGFKQQLTAIYNSSNLTTEIAAASGNIAAVSRPEIE